MLKLRHEYIFPDLIDAYKLKFVGERVGEGGRAAPSNPAFGGNMASSLSPLRAPLGGFADLVGIQIQKG